MAYVYDEKTKTVKTIHPPKVSGKDVKRIIKMKVPKKFIDEIMAMKMNISIV
jgi:hypothetical protein